MSAAPGRRQSTRQVTRTSRPHNYYARTFSGRGAAEQPAASSEIVQPGFFPAITHFTEAVDALPKEVIRHFSMLKEVEAKVHAPDEQIRRLADAVSKLPPPPRDQPPPQPYFPSLSAHNSVNGSRHGSVVGTQLSDNALSAEATEATDRERQSLFYQLNMNIAMMAPALDEKIAVLSTANQTLQRQLDRMTSSYLHIPDEVSYEARLGNPKHWAYVTDKETKKAPERSRREAANTNALTAAAQALEGEFASRSEARREAVAARKNRNHQIDSDFDDRPAPRKGPGKSKKTADDPKLAGLGIVNGVAGPTKRRKVAAAAPMERSLSGVLANNARGNHASPRETPDVVPKKRSKPGPAPKKRTPGNASPHITSSPVIGAFAPKESAIRPGTGRGRQNSATNSIHSATVETTKNRPPSSHSNRAANNALSLNTYEQLQQSAAAVENPEGPKPVPDQAKIMKSEEADANDDVSMPDVDAPAPPVTTRAGRTSKTATPLSSTFPDLIGARNRSARAKDATGNGSHASSESGEHRSRRKKVTTTTGSAAPSVRADNDAVTEDASAIADPEDPEPEDMDMDDADPDGEIEEIGEGEEGNEPKYCYCNDVSYGAMVACDNEACAREWFHLKCAGLSSPPDENTKWYCEECKLSMKENSKRNRPGSRRE